MSELRSTLFGCCACCPPPMGRREFLAGGIAALGLGAFAAGRNAAAQAMPHRIDVHHHVSPPSWLDAVKKAKLDNPFHPAFDNAGNPEPTNSALIRVDTTAPSSSIACAGGSCAGYFSPGVSVTLSATDADSGVASIRYTTNGTDPTSSNGTTYGGAFPINSTTTVKYRAFDNVGRAEAVNSQLVQIDSSAPTVSRARSN